MNKFIFFTLIICCSNLFGQDTISLTRLREQFDDKRNPIMYNMETDRLFSGFAVDSFYSAKITLIQEYVLGSLIRSFKLHNNSSILSITLYNEKGHREGEYVEYSPKGDIVIHGQYLDDEQEGVWIYFTNNRIEKMGTYKKGKKEGNWLYYNEHGDAILEEQYKNGQLVK